MDNGDNNFNYNIGNINDYRDPFNGATNNHDNATDFHDEIFNLNNDNMHIGHDSMNVPNSKITNDTDAFSNKFNSNDLNHGQTSNANFNDTYNDNFNSFNFNNDYNNVNNNSTKSNTNNINFGNTNFNDTNFNHMNFDNEFNNNHHPGHNGKYNHKDVKEETNNNNNNPRSPSRLRRQRAKGETLNILKREFEKNQSPSIQQRKSLSERIGMTEKSVTIWFQNRRAKLKKKKLKEEQERARNKNKNKNYKNKNRNSKKLKRNNSNRSDSDGYNSESDSDSSSNNNYSYGNSSSYNSDNNSCSSTTDNSSDNQMDSDDSDSRSNSTSFCRRVALFDNIPLNINKDYYLMDICSLTVGTWNRMKSGSLTKKKLKLVKNLRNLSPRSINDIMSNMTDFLVIISKKNFEINYFFSATTKNNNILFRVFFAIDSITNCSLSLESDDIINSNHNTHDNNSNSNQASSKSSRGSDSKRSIQNLADMNGNEFGELKITVDKSPNFAVYFSEDKLMESTNQWSICEDFSEGKQVNDAYIGGSNLPHVLKGLQDSLRFMNSLILDYKSTNQVLPPAPPVIPLNNPNFTTNNPLLLDTLNDTLPLNTAYTPPFIPAAGSIPINNFQNDQLTNSNNIPFVNQPLNITLQKLPATTLTNFPSVNGSTADDRNMSNALDSSNTDNYPHNVNDVRFTNTINSSNNNDNNNNTNMIDNRGSISRANTQNNENFNNIHNNNNTNDINANKNDNQDNITPASGNLSNSVTVSPNDEFFFQSHASIDPSNNILSTYIDEPSTSSTNVPNNTDYNNFSIKNNKPIESINFMGANHSSNDERGKTGYQRQNEVTPNSENNKNYAEQKGNLSPYFPKESLSQNDYF